MSRTPQPRKATWSHSSLPHMSLLHAFIPLCTRVSYLCTTAIDWHPVQVEEGGRSRWSRHSRPQPCIRGSEGAIHPHAASVSSPRPTSSSPRPTRSTIRRNLTDDLRVSELPGGPRIERACELVLGLPCRHRQRTRIVKPVLGPFVCHVATGNAGRVHGAVHGRPRTPRARLEVSALLIATGHHPCQSAGTRHDDGVECPEACEGERHGQLHKTCAGVQGVRSLQA